VGGKEGEFGMLYAMVDAATYFLRKLSLPLMVPNNSDYNL
jgi:hypothetical protein